MAGVIHVDLMVNDMTASLRFYEALGFSVIEDAVVQGAAVAFYSNGAADEMRLVMLKPPGGLGLGAMVELMELRMPEGEAATVTARESEPAPSIRNFTIAVDDVDACLAKLATIDVKPASRTIRMQLPKLGNNRIVFVRDPDGNLVELVDDAAVKVG